MLLLIPFLITPLLFAQCEPPIEAAEKIRAVAKSAKHTDNIVEAHRYAKEIMNLADSAMDAAQACQCDEAFEAAMACYRHALKAREKFNVDLIVANILLTRQTASELITASQKCQKRKIKP